MDPLSVATPNLPPETERQNTAFHEDLPSEVRLG